MAYFLSDTQIDLTYSLLTLNVTILAIICKFHKFATCNSNFENHVPTDIYAKFVINQTFRFLVKMPKKWNKLAMLPSKFIIDIFPFFYYVNSLSKLTDCYSYSINLTVTTDMQYRIESYHSESSKVIMNKKY